jgi:hypothetical protein
MYDDTTPISELRRNAFAALLVLLTVGCGALLVISLLDMW